MMLEVQCLFLKNMKKNINNCMKRLLIIDFGKYIAFFKRLDLDGLPLHVLSKEDAKQFLSFESANEFKVKHKLDKYVVSTSN